MTRPAKAFELGYPIDDPPIAVRLQREADARANPERDPLEHYTRLLAELEQAMLIRPPQPKEQR
jgi:hypothetical protein